MEKAIIFFEIMSGVLVFRRIADEIRTNFLFNQKQLTKIVAAFFLMNSLLAFISTRSLSLFTLVWAIILSQFAFLPSITRWQRIRAMKNQIPLIVSALILHIRIGLGLRPALLRVAEQFGGYTGAKLRLLHEHLVVKATMAQVDSNLYELQTVLGECDAESHLNSKRLAIYRHKLRVQQTFRRKRSQALKQIRAQSWVLTLIYVGVFVFVGRRFGFAEHGRTMLASLLIFVVGVAATFWQGARFNWKT